MPPHRTWDDITGQEDKMPPQRWGNDGDNVAGEILGAAPLHPAASFPAVATELEEGREHYGDIEESLTDAVTAGDCKEGIYTALTAAASQGEAAGPLYSLGKLLGRGARLVETCYDRIEYLHTLALLLYRKTVKLELELDGQQLQLADQNDRHVHLQKKCDKLEVRFSSAILRLPVSGC
jgi:hypothetical protein